MADAKQDKNKQDKKEANSEGLGFKTVMGGFDKNEVNIYISKLTREKRKMEEELNRRIINLQETLSSVQKEASDAKSAKKEAEQAAATAAAAPVVKDNSAETQKLIADLKAESDKKIMDLRKLVLDERRKVAKFDKDCAMAQMSEKKLREEFDRLKVKYHELKQRGGGGSGKAVTSSNADEILAEAGAYAKEIISSAKAYAQEAAKATDKYKADVEAELKERFASLSDLKQKIDEQVKKAEQERDDARAQARAAEEKISSLASLFSSFSTQFSNVSSTVDKVTSQIGDISKQITETTVQFDSAAKQITEATGKITSVTNQITATTGQIDIFTKQINETTGRINQAKTQISGFSKSLSDAKEDINGLTAVVQGANSGTAAAQSTIDAAKKAMQAQSSSADLSGFTAIGAQLEGFSGELRSKLTLPEFDESKFSDSKIEELRNKFRIDVTYESDGNTETADDFDEFDSDESDIIASVNVASDAAPMDSIPSDDDLMANTPDVIATPVFEDEIKETRSAPAKQPDDKPILDSGFEDFLVSPTTTDDDMTSSVPLINTADVGAIDDFSLDSEPEPIGEDFDLQPNDLSAKPQKGNDLGEDIFDMAINPVDSDDNTLADMMADAKKAEEANNFELTAENISSGDEFGEFADLFASPSPSSTKKSGSGSSSGGSAGGDDFMSSFGSDSDEGSDDTDSDLSSDFDLSELLL